MSIYLNAYLVQHDPRLSPSASSILIPDFGLSLLICRTLRLPPPLLSLLCLALNKPGTCSNATTASAACLFYSGVHWPSSWAPSLLSVGR